MTRTKWVLVRRDGTGYICGSRGGDGLAWSYDPFREVPFLQSSHVAIDGKVFAVEHLGISEQLQGEELERRRR